MGVKSVSVPGCIWSKCIFLCCRRSVVGLQCLMATSPKSLFFWKLCRPQVCLVAVLLLPSLAAAFVAVGVQKTPSSHMSSNILATELTGLEKRKQAFWVCIDMLLGAAWHVWSLSSSATDQEEEMHKKYISNSAYFGTEQNLHVVILSDFLLLVAL